LATPPADTNLSLGKLGKATGVNSDYTSETLMSDGAGNSTADQNHSIGNFYIGAVDSTLTGYAYVDEQTNETYEVTFTDNNSLFASRIAARYQNFTWTTSNSSLFNLPASQYRGVTTLMTGSAIADTTTYQSKSFESNLVTDGDFDDWTGTTALDQWTESGTINKLNTVGAPAGQSPSGSNDFAVQFTADTSYIEQSFTVKGNSTYQIKASGHSDDPFSDIDMYISGAFHQQTWGNICGASVWNETRDDFYTSGSQGENHTLKIKFTAQVADPFHPMLDGIYFERWEGANFSDTEAIITGKYNDSTGDDEGFNDHATRYNTAISKTVEIQDTYAGQAIACFLPGTKIKMSDGTDKNIEDINVGDEVMSLDLPGLPDEDLGYLEWKVFTMDPTYNMSSVETSTATVEHMFFDYMTQYWEISFREEDGEEDKLSITREHDIFVRDGNEWGWKTPNQIKVGDIFLDYEKKEKEVIEVNLVKDVDIEVVNIDVEPLDVYYAGGILVHNKGTN
jgi:hypothetical protein